jgi:hypothetical protein
LIGIVLRFARKVEIAFGGAKPFRIASAVLRRRRVSQRLSANAARKTQGVCATKARSARLNAFQVFKERFHPAGLDGERMTISACVVNCKNYFWPPHKVVRRVGSGIEKCLTQRR